MMKLNEDQLNKNKSYADKNGLKLDEQGRIIIKENVKFQIHANITPIKEEVKQ